MKSQRVCSLCAAAFVAACSSVPDKPVAVVPVPLQWAGAPVVPAPAKVQAVGWAEFFTDPYLASLIRTALAYNRDAQLAASRVLEAKAQYGLASAERLPGINASLGAGVSGVPADFSGTGAYSVGRRLDASVSISGFEVDLWGRLSAASAAARAGLLSAEHAQRAVQIALVAEVALSYYALLQAQETVALGLEILAAREETLALVERGSAIGGTFQLEVEQAAATLESARATVDGLRHQERLAFNRLSYLVGYSVVPQTKDRLLPKADALPAVRIGVPSTVLLVRPDVMAAEQRLQAAHANVEAARAAFLPRLVLTTSLGLASQGLSNLLGAGAWAFQPVLSAPLFDGGRLNASLDLAQARTHSAVADYERTIQQAFREVADILSSKQSLVSQRNAMYAQLRSQTAQLQISQARHDGGVSSYREVLDARRDWLAGREMEIQLRRAQLDLEVQLFKALGGHIAG